MKDIITVLKLKSGLRYLGGVDELTIKESEDKLNLRFSEEYKKYLAEFGVATFASTELTGIVASKRLNVVDVTNEEKSTDPNFPENMYVIEMTGFEGLDILQDENGIIYEFIPYRGTKQIAGSLAEYLETR